MATIATTSELRAAPWTVRLAHLIPFTVLPSGLWRLPLAFGATMGMTGVDVETAVGTGESIYIVALTLTTEALALLSLGLVRPWGERAPAWLPVIGGRPLAPRAVVGAGAVGSAALTAIWLFAAINFFTVADFAFTGAGWEALMIACYAPALLWGPLLGVLTFAYWRRRVAGRA